MANIGKSELAKVCTIVNTYEHYRATDIEDIIWPRRDTNFIFEC